MSAIPRFLLHAIPPQAKVRLRPLVRPYQKLVATLVRPLRIARILPYVWHRDLREFIAFRTARTRYAKDYENVNDDPLISIIIPTYNRAELLLSRALPCILAQTYTNFELIIVGDHCTDNTQERLGTVTDPRIRFYNLPERPKYPKDKKLIWLVGGYHAMNIGRKMARGKWLASCDDDDEWMPDHLERLLRFAQHGNYEFASSQSIMELPNGTTRLKGKAPALSLTDKTHSTYFSRTYLNVIDYEYRSYLIGRCIDKQILVKYKRAGVRGGFLEEATVRYKLNNVDTRHFAN